MEFVKDVIMILEILGKVILAKMTPIRNLTRKCSRHAKNAQLGLRGNATRFEYYI